MVQRRLHRVSALISLLGGLLASPARADTSVPGANDAARSELLRAPLETTRRHGFLLGGTLGLRLQYLDGYPLAFSRRNAENEAKLGPFFSPGGTLFIGGAIADWLALAIEIDITPATHKGVHASGSAGGLKIMAWPLFDLGGVYQDLGDDLTFGTGSARLTDVATGDVIADSSSFAFFATSVFWEALRVGGLNLGPAVGFDYRSSATYTALAGWVGARVVFYGGP